MQGNRLLLAAVSSLAALSFATSAQADCCGGGFPSCNMSVPCGWYAELNIGWTRISGDNATSTSSGTNVGGNLNLGYKLMPYLAIEIGGTKYPNGEVKAPVTGEKVATTKFYSYDLALKAIAPISDSGVEFFGKFGVARMNASATLNVTTLPSGMTITNTSGSRNATGYYIGLGGQYYFTPEMAAVAQWQRAQANNRTNATFDLYSLGVSYIFD